MWTVLWIIFLIIVLSAAMAGISAAPWVPTLSAQRKHLLDNLSITPGQTVVDLGCGDGAMLFEVARRYPNTVCTGYEISILPLLLAWTRKLLYFKAYRNVHIRFGNLFKQDLKQADIIFIFLLTKCYPKLITSLRGNVSPNARIVIEAWPLPEIELERILKADGLLPMYVYSGQALQVKP